MKRNLGGALALLALALAAGCGRGDRTRPEELRAQIASLQRERDQLRRRFDELVAGDPNAAEMPANAVRIGVPTALVRELAEKLTAGFVDQVTLELSNLRARKSGTVRKIVTLGRYDLDVRIERVHGQLRTEKPQVSFGGNTVRLELPVSVASGNGQATVRFKWDGRNVSGAACGDLDVRQVVSGTVKPNRYRVRGTLLLETTADRVVATPRVPPLRVKLEIEPSRESWAAVQALLDSKQGLCGFALDRIDVLGIVRGLVQRGFEVRLPTERLGPVAVPIRVAPSLNVQGRAVALDVRLARLAITERMMWLGAEVAVAPLTDRVSPAASGSAAPRRP